MTDLTCFMTLTDLPNDWDSIHPGVRVFQRRMCRAERPLRWAYVIEPSAEGNHLHALLRGMIPDEDDVIAASRSVFGSSVVDIIPARLGHAGYLLKMARTGPPTPYSYARWEIADHRRRNGGRLINSSHGFFDGRLRDECRRIRRSRRPDDVWGVTTKCWQQTA